MSFPGRINASVSPRQLFFAIVFAAPMMAALGACSSSSGGEPPCFPPAYSVSPTSAKPGEVVTVSAPPAGCNPRYGTNAHIHVSVTDKAGTPVINKTAPMTDSGAFTFNFKVPAEMAVGKATVTAMPYNIDWCDDTGRNNRADGPANFDLASCALPAKQLTITR